MRRRILTGTVLALALLAPAAANTALAQPYPPIPPPRAEVMPPAPPGNYVWQRGHWTWNGVTYVWRPGHWVIRRGAWHEWIPGHWGHRYGHPVWVPGHWI